MIKRIIRKLLRFLSKQEIKERQYAVGINSYIDKEKDLHIIMLDYDTQDLDFVLKDLKELVKFWNLSDYEIYKTTNGYHTFFWYDHIPYSRLKMIIDYSNCDTSYKYISKFYDYKTVRASGKYKQKDIEHIGKFSGSRLYTNEQRVLGDLKRKEYLLLKEDVFFKEEVLK